MFLSVFKVYCALAIGIESNSADESVTFKETRYENCKPAIGGPGIGKPCIFPFKWIRTGKTYTECTTDGGNEHWCSTKVDEDGEHLSGNWGECGPGCPGVPDDGDRTVYKYCPAEGNKKCRFPFTIDGFSYRGCLESSSHRHGFCLTKDPTAEDLLVKVGCTASCPKDYWLTDKDVPMEDIIIGLIKTSVVVTSINREKNCTHHLNNKFEEMDKSKLPKEVNSTRSWKEAFKQACKNSLNCVGHENSMECQSRQVEKRKNALTKRKHDRRPLAKSDCKIQCGYPDKDY